MIKYTKKQYQYFLTSLRPGETLMASARIWIMVVTDIFCAPLRTFFKPLFTRLYFSIDNDRATKCMRRIKHPRIPDIEFGRVYLKPISFVNNTGAVAITILNLIPIFGGAFCPPSSASYRVQTFAHITLKNIARFVKKDNFYLHY